MLILFNDSKEYFPFSPLEYELDIQKDNAIKLNQRYFVVILVFVCLYSGFYVFVALITIPCWYNDCTKYGPNPSR